MDRASAVATIADGIASSATKPQPLLVGIDGIDCAGKTTLAEELRDELVRRGVSVVRASIDGFHRPREQRLAKGSLSPEGYYRDSFDYRSLIDEFLSPIKGATSTVSVITSLYDWTSEEPRRERTKVTAGSLLLFEGVVLYRPEIDRFWDFRVFVDIPLSVSLNRGVVRDAEHFGGEEGARERYLYRYIPGQEIYLREVAPSSKANVIIHNEDPHSPRVTWADGDSPASSRGG
jgi:uridine kinase